MKKQFVLFVLALSAVLLFSGCNDTTINTETKAPPTASTIATPIEQPTQSLDESSQNKITVVDLYNEFKADEDAATNKYNGKSVTSTGVVTRTGADIHGTPSVELSDTLGGKVYVLYVVNSFDQLSEISVGETIAMKGNFHVFSTGEWGVVMKQGEIIKGGNENEL